MIELGERAMPEQFSSSVPYAGMHGEIGVFHRTWMGCPSPMKHVVYIFYVRTGSPKEKAIDLGMPRSEMYNYLDRFMWYYEGKMDSGIACSETLIMAV